MLIISWRTRTAITIKIIINAFAGVKEIMVVRFRTRLVDKTLQSTGMVWRREKCGSSARVFRTANIFLPAFTLWLWDHLGRLFREMAALSRQARPSS